MSTPEVSRRPTWLWPLLAGVAALLIVCGAGALVLYTKARDTVDTALTGPSGSVGPVPQVSEPPAPVATGPNGAPAPAPARTGVRPTSTGVPCAFTKTGLGGGEPRLVPMPPARSTWAGTVDAEIRTGLGPLGIRLYADRAPCTVHSFAHLVQYDYFTETTCHRITTEGLWVLQCGDPGGTGTGSPGYEYGEENLPTTVPPYPRGTLAMANAGPGTNGSQFFIVYRDSDIPADYTVFGTVTSGLDLIDRVAAAGTEDGTADGRPKLEVKIDEVVLS